MIERRQVTIAAAKVQIRESGSSPSIVGYAAVFYREGESNTEYRIWSDYVERLDPGCFDRAIAEKHDARGLFDHDSQNLLGRVSNGTCNLTVDDVGLRFEIPFDKDDPDHQRVAAKIRRGDLSGCSFAFANASSEWEEKTDAAGASLWIRNITDLDLYDVGPVTYPAYEATEVGLRTSAPNRDEVVQARSALVSHREDLLNLRRSVAIDIDHTFNAIR